MQRDLKALVDGAIGGGVGTAVMSLVMLGARRAGLMGEHPPEKITARMLDAVGLHRRDAETQDALAVAGHFAFGIAAGALFAVQRRRLRPPIPSVLHGALFATLVWAVSYKGWVPGLEIMPPPERDRPDRPLVMLVAHWVYGAVLGAIVGRR